MTCMGHVQINLTLVKEPVHRPVYVPGYTPIGSVRAQQDWHARINRFKTLCTWHNAPGGEDALVTITLFCFIICTLAASKLAGISKFVCLD